MSRGGIQHVLRASRPAHADRMDTTVGPLSVEVVEACAGCGYVDGADSEVELDVQWEGAIPAHSEPHHLNRRGPVA